MRTELVATLKRQATELLSEIERDSLPGMACPARILSTLKAMNKFKWRMAVLEGIARVEQAVAEGRVASHAQARKPWPDG